MEALLQYKGPLKHVNHAHRLPKAPTPTPTSYTFDEFGRVQGVSPWHQEPERTPEEARQVLSAPDVTVTNQGDKDMQLKKIEKIDGERGSELTFDDVLLVGNDDETHVGTPTVAGASVNGTIIEQDRDKKDAPEQLLEPGGPCSASVSASRGLRGLGGVGSHNRRTSQNQIRCKTYGQTRARSNKLRRSTNNLYEGYV